MLTEHLEQCLFVDWCRAQSYLIFAIPNGGKRNINTARKLKKEGVLAGVPDLMLPIPSKEWHGLFIEMKSVKGKATLSQKNIMLQLSKNGYLCVVCKGFEEAKHAVKNYMLLK